MKTVKKNGFNIVEPDLGTIKSKEELIALKEYAENPNNDCQGFYAEYNGLIFDCIKGKAVPVAAKGKLQYILCKKQVIQENQAKIAIENDFFNKVENNANFEQEEKASIQKTNIDESKDKEILQLKAQLYDLQNENRYLRNKLRHN